MAVAAAVLPQRAGAEPEAAGRAGPRRHAAAAAAAPGLRRLADTAVVRTTWMLASAHAAA